MFISKDKRTIKEKLLSLVVINERKKNESYDEYRRKRKESQRVIKNYLKGSFIWGGSTRKVGNVVGGVRQLMNK